MSYNLFEGLAKMEAELYMKQNALSALLILGALIFVLLLSPSIKYEPRGVAYRMAQSVESTKLSAEEEVRFYETRPYRSEMVGKIVIEYSRQTPAKDFKSVMLVDVQRRAAKLGANGFVIEQFGILGEVYLLEGSAIRV